VINIKTAEEIALKMETWLSENTKLNYFGTGSIVRAFIDIISECIGEFYDRLDFNLTNQFVSTASGSFLDLIGDLLSCKRSINESDDNYRFRVANQVYSARTSNEIAVRLACLSIPNVKNIILKEYITGAGSFAVYVDVVDRNVQDATVAAVNNAVQEVKAFGVNGRAVLPEQIPVNLKVKLTYVKELSQQEKQFIIIKVTENLRQYLDNLGIGETVSGEKIFFNIFESSNDINTADITSFEIGGDQYTVTSIQPRWNQQFKMGTVEVA
jgi:uncharacterized phage protein gp47/JayE